MENVCNFSQQKQRRAGKSPARARDLVTVVIPHLLSANFTSLFIWLVASALWPEMLSTGLVTQSTFSRGADASPPHKHPPLTSTELCG